MIRGKLIDFQQSFSSKSRQAGEAADRIDDTHSITKETLFYVLIFIIMFAASAASPMAFSVILGSLCIVALVSTSWAFKALSLCAIFKVLNPSLYAFSLTTTALLISLMLIASLRILLSVSSSHISMITPLFVFYVILLALSIFFSASAEVSLLKATLFALVVSSVLVAAYQQPEDVVNQWKAWFLALSVTLVIASLLTLTNYNIAYAINGKGFQGVFNQPQVFGTWSATLAAWILFFIFSKKRSINVTYPLVSFFILVGMIFASQARTAMVALLLALITTYLLGIFLGELRRNSDLPIGKITIIGTLGIVVIILSIASSQKTSEYVNGFVFKRDAKTTSQALKSRGGGAIEQWGNFLAQPLSGNGFGVYADGHFPGGIKRLWGIPISAAVEKGFFPTAIFEEIGLIGFIFFLWFFFSMVKIVCKGGTPWIALFFACFYSNFGEYTYFSVGGIGLYYWCLVGLCIADGSKVTKTERSSPSRQTEKTYFNRV